MKKTNKENPLTFFRKANEARQKVVKNSLTKARDGRVVISAYPKREPVPAGPQTEMQSIFSNAMSSQPPVPYANRPSREEMMMQTMMGQSARSNVDTANAMRDTVNAMRSSPQGAMQAKAANMNKAYMDALTNRPKSNTPMLDSVYPKQKTTKGIVAGQEMEFTPEQMKSIFGIQKKGGSVKSKKK